MAKKLHLSIPEPCHEDWDAMTPEGKNRFCGACQKSVVDFSGMSDAQLIAFFRKKSSESVCGRLNDYQVDRSIEIPKKRIPWVRYFLQVAIPAFIFSNKGYTQGKINPLHKTSQMAIAGDRDEDGNDGREITGQVVNEVGEPVPYASILSIHSNGTMADSAGNFILKLETNKEIKLIVSSVGYEPTELTVLPSTSQIAPILKKKSLDEVIVTSYGLKGKISMVLGGISIISVKTETLEMPKIENPPPAMITIYPNPVVSGSSINIGCEKLESDNYSIQVFNQSGQRVLNKQSWIDGDAQVLNLDIPMLPMGNYIITMVGKGTKKRFSEKIIIVN